jgi:hypothetical protein
MDIAPSFEFNCCAGAYRLGAVFNKWLKTALLPVGNNHRLVEPIGFGDPEMPAADYWGY